MAEERGVPGFARILREWRRRPGRNLKVGDPNTVTSMDECHHASHHERLINLLFARGQQNALLGMAEVQMNVAGGR